MGQGFSRDGLPCSSMFGAPSGKAGRLGPRPFGCSLTHRCRSWAVTTGGPGLLTGLRGLSCSVASPQRGDLRVLSLLTWQSGPPEKVFRQSGDHITSLCSLRQSSHRPIQIQGGKVGEQRPNNLGVMTYLRKNI